MKPRHLWLAGLLAIAPMTFAAAQSTTGSGTTTTTKGQSEANTTPGSTGKTTVPGNNSTVASDRKATGMKASGGGSGGDK